MPSANKRSKGAPRLRHTDPLSNKRHGGGKSPPSPRTNRGHDDGHLNNDPLQLTWEPPQSPPTLPWIKNERQNGKEAHLQEDNSAVQAVREDLSKGGAGLRLKSPPKRTLRVPEKIIITPPGGSSLTYTLTGVSDTMEKWRSPKPEAGSPEVEYDLRSRSPSPTQDGSPPPRKSTPSYRLSHPLALAAHLTLRRRPCHTCAKDASA